MKEVETETECEDFFSKMTAAAWSRVSRAQARKLAVPRLQIVMLVTKAWSYVWRHMHTMMAAVPWEGPSLMLRLVAWLEWALETAMQMRTSGPSSTVLQKAGELTAFQ